MAVRLTLLLLLCFASCAYAQDDTSEPVDSHAGLGALVEETYRQFIGQGDGRLPDYIPALEQVDTSLFGIAVVTTDGETYAAGHADEVFAVMSAAKPFTLALVMEQLGAQTVLDKIGVEPTGLPFNSITAIELNSARSVNPMVNAGAMAAVSLVQGTDAEQKWQRILDWYGRFANAPLPLMQAVYESVRDSGYRNRSMTYLLQSYGRLYADPVEVRDIYNRQSSVGVTTRQLAWMGATLANGGLQPVSGQRVMRAGNVPGVLAVMMMAGMYDDAGKWAWQVGLPAKSGVGGGIVAVAPGKLAIAAYSPLLDEHGNSVRAQAAIRHISQRLGLGLFGPTGRE